MDRDTGRSRGFGFVEMEVGADEAIAEPNGHKMDSRHCGSARQEVEISKGRETDNCSAARGF